MKVTDYRVIRLDRRYNGHLKFKYAIDTAVIPRLEQQRVFQALREWAWATYGPSMELGWVLEQSNYNETEPIWAWETDYGKKRLYLKGDAELTFWQLKFN